MSERVKAPARGRQVAVVDAHTGEVLHEGPAGGAVPAPHPGVVAPLSFGEVLERLASPEAIEQQRQLMALYDQAVHALVGPNDVHEEGGRQFKKKSAWRKIGRYFGISTEIVRIESRWEWDEEEQIKHFVARVTVRGTAPWGQTTEAVGVCSTREKRFYTRDGRPNDTARRKAEHDCEATAATRATNRVISDLVAAGEVSAEEVEGGDHGTDARQSIPDRGDGQRATPAQRRRIERLLEERDVPADELMWIRARLEDGLSRRKASMVIDRLEKHPPKGAPAPQPAPVDDDDDELPF